MNSQAVFLDAGRHTCALDGDDLLSAIICGGGHNFRFPPSDVTVLIIFIFAFLHQHVYVYAYKYMVKVCVRVLV